MALKERIKNKLTNSFNDVALAAPVSLIPLVASAVVITIIATSVFISGCLDNVINSAELTVNGTSCSDLVTTVRIGTEEQLNDIKISADNAAAGQFDSNATVYFPKGLSSVELSDDVLTAKLFDTSSPEKLRVSLRLAFNDVVQAAVYLERDLFFDAPVLEHTSISTVEQTGTVRILVDGTNITQQKSVEELTKSYINLT